MRIAICEDNNLERMYLNRLLTHEIDNRKWNCRTSLFASGADFIASLAKTRYDLVFMDIYLEDASGVDLIQKLHDVTPDCVVIFTTNSTDHYADGFELGALHYLLKPIKPAHLTEALNRCARLTGNVSRYITVSVKGTPRHVSLAQISHIEVFNKYCVIHTTAEVLEVKIPLRQLIAEINSADFVQCHRSFCVHLPFVKGFAGHCTLTMTDGSEIPVSRDKRAAMLQTLDQFRAASLS